MSSLFENEPLTIIIFGATGDLSKSKLLAALMDLSCGGYLPSDTRIVGVSRKELTDIEFQDMAREAIGTHALHHTPEKVETYLETLRYVRGDTTEPVLYPKLAEYLHALDARRGICSNKLFYLSVHPSLYAPIFENLSQSGLGIPCAGKSWVRVAVEKPFGRDSESAALLDAKLTSLFDEEQIYRIDHYLAKEVLENIIAFRFANTLFEPTWNNQYIESVHIRIHEREGIGTRGTFFEDVGNLRDMGQNHVLQMLAYIAIDDPHILSPESIRAERERVLAALIPLDEQGYDSVVKGQYAGYRHEHNVADSSMTETYFKCTAYLDLPRWRGVPFVLEAGKKLAEDIVDITITYKAASTCMSRAHSDATARKNTIVFSMKPEQHITVTFYVKQHGFTMAVEQKKFSFNYAEGETRLRDAYEKLLFDCVHGDQTLFTTGAEVASAWRFITPLLHHWEGREPVIYEDNSEGPAVKDVGGEK